MTRPLKFMKLSAALNLVVAHTSETDVARRRPALRDKYKRMGFFLPEANESCGDPIARLNKDGNDSWLRRESAVLRMESAITDGKIDIFARDPKSVALFHVDSQGWRGAAFREQSLRGGTFRGSACDSIEQYDGWDALADIESVERWLSEEKSRRPVADERECGAWLLEAMFASPKQKIGVKRDWRIEAQRLFGVSIHAFNRAWSSAVKTSGSNWNQSGAPRKSSNNQGERSG